MHVSPQTFEKNQNIASSKAHHYFLMLGSKNLCNVNLLLMK